MMLVDVAFPMVDASFVRQQSSSVPKHKESVLCSSYRNVQPFLAPYESDLLVLVGSYAGHDDDVSLLSLKGVHCAHFQSFVGLEIVLFVFNQ